MIFIWEVYSRKTKTRMMKFLRCSSFYSWFGVHGLITWTRNLRVHVHEFWGSRKRKIMSTRTASAVLSSLIDRKGQIVTKWNAVYKHYNTTPTQANREPWTTSNLTWEIKLSIPKVQRGFSLHKSWDRASSRGISNLPNSNQNFKADLEFFVTVKPKIGLEIEILLWQYL